MGLLHLRLVTQLVQEKGLLPDLDVITEEERDRELKKDQKVSSNAKTFFLYPQPSDPEGGMAENEDV